MEPVEPVQANIYKVIPIKKTSAGSISMINQGFKRGRKWRTNCPAFSDSICVGCRKLKYQAYIIKNCRGESKPPLPHRRYYCESDFVCFIMPKHCVAVGCTNHNFMHEKKLSFFRFPKKLKQSQRWEKWVQAVKRVNPDGSKWEPHGNYVYLCSDHFLEGTITTGIS